MVNGKCKLQEIRVTLLLLLVIGVSFCNALPLRSDELPTVEQIRLSLPNYRQRIRSCLVEYTQVRTTNHFNGDSSIKADTITFAVLDDLRYKKMIGDSGVEPETTFVFDGHSTFTIFSTQVTSVSRKDPSIDLCYYCDETLFLKLPDDSRVSEQSPFYFPDCIDENYKIIGTEEINGCVCFVLQGAIDKLWLDPEIGYSIRRREIDPTGIGKPRFIYENADFSLRNELWIPFKVTRVESYRPGEQSTNSGLPIESIEIAVQKFQANSVDESFFDLEVPNGLLYIGEDGVFTIGGSDAKKLSEIIKSKSPTISGSTRTRLLIFFPLVLVTGWLLYSKFLTKNDAGEQSLIEK